MTQTEVAGLDTSNLVEIGPKYSMPDIPTVHILLATYNGAKYLSEQLDSIARQTYSRWTLTVSDDGSSDETVCIVQRFAQSTVQPVKLLLGPRKGSSTRNFFHLIQQAPSDDPQALYAFCDQDDVWLDNKLERAVHWHINHLSEPVRLCCGRTRLVNEQLSPIGLSPGIRRTPSFGNALVQNIASGNTMVMSHAVLVAQKIVQPEHSVWHDWTTYILATAMGGKVYFDNTPLLLYRQHSNNVIGVNTGFISYAARLLPLLRGRFRSWSDVNMKAINDVKNIVSPNAIKVCSDFNKIRGEASVVDRIGIFFSSEIRRQSALSNFKLLLALIFRLT